MDTGDCTEFEGKRQGDESSAPRTRKLRLMFGYTVILVVLFGLMLTLMHVYTVDKETTYDAGMSYMVQGDYEAAILEFSSIRQFRDSSLMVLENRYRHAHVLLEVGEYREALRLFESLGYYGRSDEILYDWQLRLSAS